MGNCRHAVVPTLANPAEMQLNFTASFFPSNPTLIGQVAIVTGSSSGIGSAVAMHLAMAGVRVALLARNEERLKSLQRNIEEGGGIAICVKADVRNREDMTNAVAHVENLLGPVDILVNNAGVMYFTTVAKCRLDEWDEQVDVNVKGVLNAVGAVVPGMVLRGEGHIVNMSSDAGVKAFPGLAVYSGTKHFVEGFSRAMRAELAGQGVKVTTVQPGDVSTGLHQKSTDLEAKATYDSSDQYEMLNAEDVARAVLFAISQPHHCAVNEILIEPRAAPI